VERIRYYQQVTKGREAPKRPLRLQEAQEVSSTFRGHIGYVRSAPFKVGHLAGTHGVLARYTDHILLFATQVDKASTTVRTLYVLRGSNS
jgi:hypothetical protein